jgi:hypothetical protein
VILIINLVSPCLCVSVSLWLISETGMAVDAFLLESNKIKKSDDLMRGKNTLRITIIASMFALFWLAAPWPARQARQAQRDPGLEKSVRPFLAEHCIGCHNADMKAGGLNLEGYSTVASIIQDRQRWEEVARKIRSGEMPPKACRVRMKLKPRRSSNGLKIYSSKLTKRQNRIRAA